MTVAIVGIVDVNSILVAGSDVIVLHEITGASALAVRVLRLIIAGSRVKYVTRGNTFTVVSVPGAKQINVEAAPALIYISVFG
jgi:hypothetical protein